MNGQSGWFARLMALFGQGAREETWHDLAPGEGISESDRFLLDALPFEWISVHGNRAMAEWTRLRREGRLWPVIVGGDQDLMRIAEQWGIEDRATEQILAKAEKLSHPGTLIAFREAEKAQAVAFLDAMGRPTGEDYQAPVGDWPEDGGVAPNRGPSLIFDGSTGEPLDRVHILLVPAASGHEVPAVLRWGGWNACPPPEHHAAALRQWHEEFGAELVGLSGDVMELRVTKRPATKDDALRLAREQYLYCNDIVDQGTNDLATLAAVLAGSDWWYFWWD